MRRRVDSGLILLLTPILWGATFPGTKIVLRYLPVLTFMAWSRALGFFTILALMPLVRRGADRQRSWKAVIVPGAVLGGLMFVGYVLQTEGLARTTATNAGFITGLYIVFAPLMAAVVFGHRAPRSAWLAIVVALAGLTLLSITHLTSIRLHAGDLLVLGGAAAWAAHIAAVGHLSPRHSPWMLSLSQMGWTALFQVLAASATGLRPLVVVEASVWPLLLLTGVLGSGVAFTLQILGQRTLTPARAVVVLAGESLFSAAFSAVWIGERLSAHQWVGAVLVLAAMAFSELSARRKQPLLLEPASSA